MQFFRSNDGREWMIDIRFASIVLIKAKFGIDLFRQSPPQDAVLLTDVLYALVKPQADAVCINADEFGELMTGDYLADAFAAFTVDLINFSQRPSALRRAKMKSQTSRRRISTCMSSCLRQLALSVSIHLALQCAKSSGCFEADRKTNGTIPRAYSRSQRTRTETRSVSRRRSSRATLCRNRSSIEQSRTTIRCLASRPI